MNGFRPDFAQTLGRLDESVIQGGENRPFNLIVGNAFVTRSEGGSYEAMVAGHKYQAVADGEFGVGAYGLFHFSIDNPLG
jgi:hypothetical protein